MANPMMTKMRMRHQLKTNMMMMMRTMLLRRITCHQLVRAPSSCARRPSLIQRFALTYRHKKMNLTHSRFARSLHRRKKRRIKRRRRIRMRPKTKRMLIRTIPGRIQPKASLARVARKSHSLLPPPMTTPYQTLRPHLVRMFLRRLERPHRLRPRSSLQVNHKLSVITVDPSPRHRHQQRRRRLCRHPQIRNLSRAHWQCHSIDHEEIA